MSDNAITAFEADYRWLSNFYPAPVRMYAVDFPTVEHAYQAAKTESLSERLEIARAFTPGVAKRMGRRVTMRPDWDEFRLVAMLELTRRKYQHPHLAAKLLATGDAELIEGNYWGDRFWGVCDGEGENQLGLILMQVRDELRVGAE